MYRWIRQNGFEWYPVRGAFEKNFRNSAQIVNSTVRMKETAFPMMDSYVKIEDDLCGFPGEDTARAENASPARTAAATGNTPK